MLPRNFPKLLNRCGWLASAGKSKWTSIACCRIASFPDKNGMTASQFAHHDPVQPDLICSTKRVQFPKQLSSSTSPDNDHERGIDCFEEELQEFDFDQDVAENANRQRYLKDILYPDSQDEIILRLNECLDPKEMFQIFDKYADKFNAQHATQTIILLWSCIRDSADPYSIFSYQSNLEPFFSRLEPLIQQMSYDELTCNLLYLQKMKIDSSQKVMQDLLCRIVNLIDQESNDVPLSALSRFAVAVHNNKDIYQFLVGKHIVPQALKYLERNLNPGQIHLLTICLKHLNQLVTKDILALYKKKLKDALDMGVISKADVKCILKATYFLNFPHWSQQSTPLIRSLLLLIKDEVCNLSIKEMELLVRILQSQLEPASLMPFVKEAANKLFDKCPAVATLDCLIQFIGQKQRWELMAAVERMINNDNLTPSQLPSVFRILRSLKISKTEVCNKYWSTVVDTILSNPSEQESYKVTRHCHRYMHFNNNLGGTYHHEEFEKTLCSLLRKDIHEDLSGVVPSKFMRSASFIVAYGNGIPAIVVDKMEQMKEQFKVIDCLQMSRGMQIALQMQFKNNIPKNTTKKLKRMNDVLDDCARRHLEEELTLQDLSSIIRSFTNRKASRKTYLFQCIMERYNKSIDYLNSRLVRDITLNLTTTQYTMPQICEKIIKYVYDNRDYVTGDTVEKVLTCCYNIGYWPENIEALYWCDEIIKRDFKFMNSLSIVQSCLALCYYKVLSEQLISQVFAMDFIQQVEDEIKTCYSKETYPERILNQVMQLNRAVCLDYPEAQVPWFQQNYIEAQMSKQPTVLTKFQDDVKHLLLHLVQDEQLIRCNHITPYGYRINFVVHLNKNNLFIPPPRDGFKVAERIHKVAILLQKLDAFCENKSTTMKGSEMLKLRHLEILGYNVVFINSNEWNSMFMKMPGEKVKYLKNLLQIQ